VSNVGKKGYEGFVTKLRDEHIVNGDIIQAVPSQRLSRKTQLHPFNAYRYLRQLNPSPYMFYIHCNLSDPSSSSAPSSVQLVGASPECLLSISPERIVTNHAIAGTIKRGATPAEDAELAETLKASIKDRAEHVMLVDLARNDINRVCKPESVKVAELMAVTRFSHVMHLTSTVEGELRKGLNRFDAFRSIFPAGTVSGAPKIKAMQLIASMEPSLRNVYAGAVGRWNLGKDTDECDTCIAIRTMVFKDGTVYLQAGGGIVWDSNEEEEYIETVNKLAANVRTLEKVEEVYAEEPEEQ
jgi:anthranilate synthase component 1